MNPQPTLYAYNNPYAPVVSPNVVEVLVIIILILVIVFLVVKLLDRSK